MASYSLLTVAATVLASALAKTVPANNVTLTTRACQPPYNTYPFCDNTLSLDTRLKDLISRVNQNEIPSLITARHYTPTTNNNISRLGIPEFDWGMNAIHGVQSTCIELPDGTVRCPTSWPNPVNYGMTWNRTLMYDLGRLIGKEARALWLAGALEESGSASTPVHAPHIGLDAWSPNINIARDPRWGRNQEVPSEDPLINGDFGMQHTLGLQTPAGGDSRYLQVIVTLKHWDAYSLENYTYPNGTKTERYDFNAIVSNYSLADTYWPAFKKSVMEGGAQGVMCSYNAVNGVPTCASAFLSSVLRGTWGFDGYITSDSGALENIYANHHYVADAEHAACVAIRDGTTDVCSGQVYNQSLIPAVQAGLCSMDDVNKALYNTFGVRMKLGLFDPIDDQPYWHADPMTIGTQEALDNSLLASLEGQVLLKNNGVLPIPAGKKIAVIGPHANATTALTGNYLGQICPDDQFDCIISPYLALQTMNAGGSVQYVQACSVACTDNSGFAQAVQAAQAADYAVVFVGLDGSQENEMHDRISIDLPGYQHQLIQQVAAVGKPTVVVLVHGGSVDVTAERDSPAVGAILEAGYAGFFGGQAIAMSLMGLNDHLGGRLAYTVYPSDYVTQMDMTEMELDVGVGRGYRYYTGQPVYSFGYGLALTNFSTTLVTQPKEAITEPHKVAAAAPVSAPAARSLLYIPTAEAVRQQRLYSYSVNVTNIGQMTGDTVIQAYFSPQSTPQQPTLRLIRQLFDYQRVHLAPGQSTIVTFSASASTFAVGDKASGSGDRVCTPGTFDIILTDGSGITEDIRHRVVLMGEQVVTEQFPRF